MALTAQQFYTPSFQQVFIDQETQHVMAGGKVHFLKDSDREEYKTIYQLESPNPPYNFVPAENPQTLNMAGAFDQALYLFPFDDAGNVELYYVDVYNIENVQQLNRPKMPEFAQGATGQNQDLKNYVINSQFQANLPQSAIQHPKTMVAPFGWSFVRSNNATSNDSVVFQRFNSPTTNPQSNPRYAIRVSCTNVSTGTTLKALRFKIPNVNFLQGSASFVTYSFEAISNSGSPLSEIELTLVKNYGSGGDPQEDIPQTSYTFSTGYNKFSLSFAMGDNTNKIIGSNDDDFVAFDLRFPPEAFFDVSLTNFILTPGVVVNPTCPEPNWDLLRSLAKTGDIKPVSIAFEDEGWLLADGSEQSRDIYSDLFSLYAFIQKGTTSTTNTFLQNGSTISGVARITNIASTKNMYVGMTVTGANFAAPVTITSISSPVIFVETIITTAGSANVTIDPTPDTYVGMKVTSENFAAPVTIVSISSLTSIVVSANATISGTTTGIFSTGNFIGVSANATASSTVSFTFTTAREIKNLTSTATMSEGMELTGAAFPGIPKIISVDSSTQITVNVNASSSTPDVPFTFYLTGAGDGATTFNVPKMMNNMPIGSGDLYKLGQRGGSTLINKENLPPHQHSVMQQGSRNSGGSAYQNGPNPPFRGEQSATLITNNDGAALGLENKPFLPPYLGLSFLVKT